MSGEKKKKRVELSKNQKDCPQLVESKKRKESVHWVGDENECVLGLGMMKRRGRT